MAANPGAAVSAEVGQNLDKTVSEYRGTPLDSLATTQDCLKAVEQYEDVRDDDVVICAYPGAGTHWALELTHKIVRGDESKMAERCDKYAVWYETASLNGCISDRDLRDLSQLESPRVIATHLPFHLLPQKIREGRAKVVYVFRDPRDIAVSYWHQLNAGQRAAEAPPVAFEEFFEKFMQGTVPYGLWSQHFKSYFDVKHQANVLVLQYETMSEDLKSAVTAAAKFLNKDLEETKMDLITASCTFLEAKTAHPNWLSLRQGAVGGWKAQLTVGQSERFDLHMDKEMDALDIALDTMYFPEGQIKIECPIFPNSYKYHGTRFFEPLVSYPQLKEVYSYDDVRPDDVVIWTAPRSGTHWTADMVLKILYGDDIERTKGIAWELISYEVLPMDALMKMLGGPAPQSLSELSALRSPRIIMTHLPFRLLPRRVQLGEAKVIHVERDPRDSIVSFFLLLKWLGIKQDWDEFFELFLADKTPWRKWWQIAYDYHLYGAKAGVLRLRYEDMRQDPERAVRTIANYLGKSLDDPAVRDVVERCSLDKAKIAKPESPFLRQGVSGGWKAQFTVRQIELFEERVRQLRRKLNIELPL